MKIKISTIVDLPDDQLIEGEEYRFASAVQAVFDGITNYATCKHLQDVIKWMGETSKSPNPLVADELCKYHKTWSGICEKLDWKYEEEK